MNTNTTAARISTDLQGRGRAGCALVVASLLLFTAQLGQLLGR